LKLSQQRGVILLILILEKEIVKALKFSLLDVFMYVPILELIFISLGIN
jgi:hypothetical protein